MLNPDSPSIRDPRNLRERIDGKLGYGSGLSLAEARDLLSPAERAEWVLGECLVAMNDRRFHIWVQGWCVPESLDGPAVIAAIAEYTRPLDGVIADLLRWTALRGIWARTGERKEALFNVVPEVWQGAWDHVVPYMQALSARWPEDADPFLLPAPGPWTRPATGIRPRLVFATAGEVVERTAHALWAAGADEDELDRFFWAAADDPFQAVTARVDCDAAALTALLHPVDPLAQALGVDELPPLAVVPPERETEILTAVAVHDHVVLRANAERPFAAVARSALRQDPEVLIAWTRDLRPGDEPLITTILETGHALVFIGDREALAGIDQRFFTGR